MPRVHDINTDDHRDQLLHDMATGGLDAGVGPRS